MPLPPILKPLRRPAFARYMGGEAISMIGTWMQSFTQAWYLASITSSATVLGATTFISGIPMLLLTLIGGSAADRYDKRAIVQAALVTQVLTAGSIGWLIASGNFQVWHMFVAAFALGVSTAFEVPAVSALVPEMVSRDEMAGAIALDRAVFHATRLLGPATAGYLVAKLGFAPVYFINAASYLPLILAVMLIPRRQQGTAEQEELRRGSMRAGIDYARADSPTRAMILLIAAATSFISPFIVILLPVYAQHTLRLDAASGGWLMASTGIGSVIGAIGVLAIPQGRRAIALKLGATVVVCGMVGLALSRTLSSAMASVIPLLIGLSTCFSVANIVVQERAPDELRGRISAVFSLSFFGLIPFSGLLVSMLADHFGVRSILWGGAIGYGIAATLVLAGRQVLGSAPPTPVSVPADTSEAASKP